MGRVPGGQGATAREQLRQPRLAEMIADILRERILSDEISDGDTLPNQEKLLEQFQVSKPSIREALRVLETEGLITVRRGNIGGAVVHLPTGAQAAYTLAMVLQARDTTISDVGEALLQLEPLCAGMCAARTDRAKAVVPTLRKVHEEALTSIDDELALTQATASFHSNLVTLSGNATVQLVVGAVESMWLGHVHSWAEQSVERGGFPDASYREESLAVHGRILELIEAGEREEVMRVARDHLDPTRFYQAGDGKQRVRASVLRHM